MIASDIKSPRGRGSAGRRRSSWAFASEPQGGGIGWTMNVNFALLLHYNEEKLFNITLSPLIKDKLRLKNSFVAIFPCSVTKEYLIIWNIIVSHYAQQKQTTNECKHMRTTYKFLYCYAYIVRYEQTIAIWIKVRTNTTCSTRRHSL